MSHPGKVIIIMGSPSDREHAEIIRSRLTSWGINVEMRVASAHKSPRHLLDILARYEAEAGPRVYVTVAGRSNALGGFVDAAVAAPVITCPPYSDRFGGTDIFSSLRMPSGVAPMIVLEPENAALAVAKILGVSDPDIRESVRNLQRDYEARIVEDDRQMQGL